MTEECAGGDLSSVLRCEAGNYDFAFIRNVMRSILMALEHMHSRGYVHCDVKPENTLLLRQPEWQGAGRAGPDPDSAVDPCPKLIDFGTG